MRAFANTVPPQGMVKVKPGGGGGEWRTVHFSHKSTAKALVRGKGKIPPFPTCIRATYGGIYLVQKDD